MVTDKGIILAGGRNTRLYPVTYAVSKSLLPVYNKPMVFYTVETLKKLGVSEILLITSENYLESYETLLLNQYPDILFTFKIQSEPKGIAEAFIIAEDFIQDSNIILILGDNVFDINSAALDSVEFNAGGLVFTIPVENPSSYGVVCYDESGNLVKIEEKPEIPKSNDIVTGLYIYDNSVIEKAKGLTPSKRGEIEITDINNLYLESNQLLNIKLTEEDKWFDCGTHDSLLDASIYIKGKLNEHN